MSSGDEPNLIRGRRPIPLGTMQSNWHRIVVTIRLKPCERIQYPKSDPRNPNLGEVVVHAELHRTQVLEGSIFLGSAGHIVSG